MSNSSETMLDFARRFFAAVTRGDLETVRACYAPGVVVWHNHEQVEQTAEQNLSVLGWIAQNVRDFRYEDVRCQETATGFVEQHTTCGRAPSGKEFRIPACLVVRVEGGRIVRLDEYLDSEQVKASLG